MKEVVLYRWKIATRPGGKRQHSRWSMTEEEARAIDPAAERIESTREVKMVPETHEESMRALYHLSLPPRPSED